MSQARWPRYSFSSTVSSGQYCSQHFCPGPERFENADEASGDETVGMSSFEPFKVASDSRQDGRAATPHEKVVDTRSWGVMATRASSVHVMLPQKDDDKVLIYDRFAYLASWQRQEAAVPSQARQEPMAPRKLAEGGFRGCGRLQ